MTKVCALLSWYDESPLWLSACVASLAHDVDHLVAVDGAYALFPQGTARSFVDQQQAIVETASSARIPLTLHEPAERWAGNEVEKRNFTVDLALTVAATDPSWWLMVVDADLVVRHSTGGLRQALARTDLDVAEYGFVSRLDPHENPGVERAAQDGLWQKATLERTRCLYRADPTLRYEGSHYVVRSDAGYLWGNAGHHDLLPVEDVSAELVFEHRSGKRDYERRQQARAYYRARDLSGAETLEAVSA